jgi:glucokinase
MKYVLGLDIGGTFIKGLATTPTGEVLAQHSLRTRDGLAREWQANVRLVYEGLCRGMGRPPSWLGVAAPGLPDAGRKAIAFMPGRLPGLEGLVWRKFFGFPRGVPVLNDAQAALFGEVWQGAARGSRNVVLLTLGTGVGGAAMVDGQLLRGHLGRAGHLGHISLDPQGAPDITGTPGSLEDTIGDCTVQQRSRGRFASTRALVEACRLGDGEAERIWEKSVRALAAAVASLINVLDPEVVVLGGGISRAGPMLFAPLRKLLDEFEWRPGGRKVRLVRARLGDRAGGFGAAWNALQVKGAAR